MRRAHVDELFRKNQVFLVAHNEQRGLFLRFSCSKSSTLGLRKSACRAMGVANFTPAPMPLFPCERTIFY